MKPLKARLLQFLRDPRVVRVRNTSVVLAGIFVVTLAVIWFFGGETWRQSTLLGDATVFGAIALVTLWAVDRHGGGRRPPQLPNETPHGPPNYIG